MTNTVTITKRLVNEGWSVTGSLGAGATIPSDIFVYLNTGTAVLGEFQSVVTIPDFPKIPKWTGTIVPVAVCKWVRASTIKIVVDQHHDVDEVISQLKASLQKFVKEFNSEKESTQTYVLD
jgi:hypothetical protein